MSTTIRKQDVPVIDMFDAEGEDRAIGKAVAGDYQGRVRSALNQYVLGVAFNRRVQAGDSQTDLIGRHQVKQSQVSKLVTVARLVDTHTLGVDKAWEGVNNVDHDKIETMRQNVVTYWGHATEGIENAPTLNEAFKALRGDDGEARAKVLPTIYNVFGAPSSFYNVATGAKFHESDPRNDENQDENQDDQDENQDDQDNDKTPWQDRLAAIVAQATLEGATSSDILKVVNDSLK